MASRNSAVRPVAGAPEAVPGGPLPAAAWIPANGHVCIVLLTGLGDVIHGLPVVNALRRARPDVRVTWVVEPMPAAILEGHASIDRVVVFHRKRGIAGLLDLRRRLGAQSFDLAINFNIYFKSIFPTVFAGARTRLGFDRPRTRDGVWLFSNERLPPRPRSHTQDMFLEFLARLGIHADPIEWRIELTQDEREARRRVAARFERPVAALVPASANPRKDWPADRYIELAERLDRELGLQVVLIGGPGPVETAAARTIVEGAHVDVANELGDGVRRLLWLTAAARLVIAPDTGPVHIARALGVPVVGLYGHTNPWRVGPYRAYEDLWIDRYNEPGAAPDPSRAEPRYDRMERITVDEVLAKVSLALTRDQGPP